MTIQLFQSIIPASGSDLEASAVEPTAELLGFSRFAYIRPKLYTKRNSNGDRVFDAATMAANASIIQAICQGKEFACMNIEGRLRYIITHPDADDVTPEDLRWAVGDFIDSWAALRKLVPGIKVGEWAWPHGPEPRFWLMNWLTTNFLDFLNPSCFWKRHSTWDDKIQDRMIHARQLGNEHDMPVCTWVFERHKVPNAAGLGATLFLISRLARIRMLIYATTDVDAVVFWSHTLRIAEADPNLIIPETLEPDYEPADIYAPLTVMLGEIQMRR